MKKVLKTIVLLPWWPLIWMAKDSHSGCGDRARWMLNWWKK